MYWELKIEELLDLWAHKHFLNSPCFRIYPGPELCHHFTWRCPCTYTSRPRHNEHNFPDDIFKSIFLNENAWISLNISLEFVPKVQINNIVALVQIMAWCQTGDKPLSEEMMAYVADSYIWVTRLQWVILSDYKVTGFSMKYFQNFAGLGGWSFIFYFLGGGCLQPCEWVLLIFKVPPPGMSE